MLSQKTAGRLWLWGVVLGILAFLGFYISFAVWTYQDDVELVYDNYYDKDIVFEQQIRRVERTEALPVKPVLQFNQSTENLMILFPPAMHHIKPRGDILLFRPANLHHDRAFDLELAGDTLQTLSLPDLDPGLWRIKLNWSSDGLEYYLEQILMVH